jgi:hypothetical protein
LKIDPLFPLGSQFTPPRYKFVRSSNGFHLAPHQNQTQVFQEEVVEDTSSTSTSNKALLFSLTLLTLLVLFS